MQVSITFRHMDASDAIKTHIDDHLSHLKKFLIKPLDVTVTLSVEKYRHQAEVILLEQNFQAKALETTDDMYQSIDKAFAKIEAQVKKHKAKVQEHHKHHLSVGEVAAIAEEDFEKERNLA